MYNSQASIFHLQGEGGKFRRAPSWRKKFRTKDSKSRDSGDEGDVADNASPQHVRRSGADAVIANKSTETARNF